MVRFWDALGGKGEYPKERHVSVLVEEPRLYHCSNMTGFWQVRCTLNRLKIYVNFMSQKRYLNIVLFRWKKSITLLKVT